MGELRATLGVGSAVMWIVLNTLDHTGEEGAGGSGGHKRAWLRCPWVVAGPGRGAGGWRQGLAGQRVDVPSQPSAHQVPLVWRAPEGPEGTGGLRGAVPNEVRSPSLAGGRALRRPEHPWGHEQPGPAGRTKQPCQTGHTNHNLRNWAASRPTARSTRNAILKFPGHPQCRRRNAPQARR